MASYNLEEGAQMWYLMVQADEGTPSWRRFTELLHLRYGPPLRSAPLAELAECRRTGTVAEYQDRFQALLPRAGPLQEAQRVQLFVGGLQPPLSIDVRIQNPQTLAAGRRHESGAPIRVARAIRRPGRARSWASSTADPCRPTGPTRAARSQTGSAGDHYRRRPHHQAPLAGRTRRAPSPWPLLQL
jgi:hypothetical protein